MSISSIHGRVLVTGGSGYIGSVLVPSLLENGYAATVLARREMPENKGLTCISGDIRDPRKVRAALRGCDYVIHLAGISDGGDNAATRQSVNRDCFPELIKACAEADVKRFIFVSTAAVYGLGGKAECREDMPAAPLPGYAEDKLACEAMLAALCPASMEYVIVRPGAVCGPAPHLRRDLLLHRMISDALAKGEITVQGPEHCRPHLHIKDMTNVLLALLTAKGVDRQIFNVASENLTLLELAEKVRISVGPQVRIKLSPTDDRRSYRISSDKIRQRLGFSAGFNIETAINSLKKALAV